MDISVGMNCPACGGAIDLREGENVVICKYCNSTLFVEGDSGVYTIAFKNKMTRDSVISASQTWWTHGLKARDLKRTGKILECYPIYLPFWSVTTRTAGWILGYEERTYSDGKGHTHTERVPRESMVLQDYGFSEIACDPGDLGIKSVKSLAGETSFEDFDMIPTFESTTSKDDAIAKARDDAAGRARASSNVSHVTFERLHMFPKRVSVVYYPIWVVRYSYRDRMYMDTVDGVTGNVLSGRAPGDPLFQSLAVTGGTSLGGLIAAAGLLLSEADARIAAGGIIGGLIVLYLTYRFFRHGSEIIEGDFKEKSGSVADVMKEVKEISKQIQGAYR
jgi:DNA-directed RNA polymerase subunit RPC12/RpoP